MSKVGGFESSLRSSIKKKCNGGRDDFEAKHRSCVGKAHAHGVRKAKPKPTEHTGCRKKILDQCVPKSDESLNDMTCDVDQKVPGSNREISTDDTVSLSESDNEKLKSGTDNCLSTTERLTGANVVIDRVKNYIQWVRSKSCGNIDLCGTETKMQGKVLKIRGPLGSLVDLSDPLNLKPYRRNTEFLSMNCELQKPGTDFESYRETRTEESQSHENLMNAINSLSKSATDGEMEDDFESLEVDELERVKVRHLFEKYSDITVSKNLKRENSSNVEELLSNLKNILQKRKTSAELISSGKERKKKEGVSRRITEKNETLERKWKPAGVAKTSASLSSLTVERTRMGRHKALGTVKELSGSAGGKALSVTLNMTNKSKNSKLSEPRKTLKKDCSKMKAPRIVSDSDMHIENPERLKNLQKCKVVLEKPMLRKSNVSETAHDSNCKSMLTFVSKSEIKLENSLKKKPKSQSLSEQLKSSIEDYIKKTGGARLQIVEDFEKSPRGETKKTNKDFEDFSMQVESISEHSVVIQRASELVLEKTDKCDISRTISPGKGSVRKLISSFEANSEKILNSSGVGEKVSKTPRNKTPKALEDFRKARSDEELANERACLDNEKLWLVHKGGFTAVTALPGASAQATDIGRVKVKFENSDKVLEVDEDDLEKANPSQLDRIEDLCQLRYINESSILYLLRQRYGNNLIHTYSAGNLIVINPQCTLSIYNEKVAALFRGCKSEDMPPHIYALAQTTYRSMLSTRKDQSIVLCGRSGSGKTHNFRHILSYLLHCAGSVNKVLNVERLNALHVVLEAFGNARTCLNLNATRCTNLINLDFDQSGQIASLSLQILMLEKQRIAKRPEGEWTFNVFYWLLAGAEGALAKQLLLDSSPPNNNLFVTSFPKNEDRQRVMMELSNLSLALKVLGVSDKECFVLWSVIAVIYHLGHAGAVQVGTNKWQFADPVQASKACRLLGTTAEELSQVIWDSPVSPTKSQAANDKDKPITGVEALEGFAVGLYAEAVAVVNGLINRCLTTNVHSVMSILIVDSPGFQNPASCGQQRGGTFSDLCFNYVQERLHLLYHNMNLIAPRDRYTQEHIDINLDEMYAELNSPSQLISILDKSPPSGVLKTSQTDLREVDRRGLFWLLEEETIYPNSSDDTFLERFFQHYGCKEHQIYIRKSSGVGHFVIHHFQGTNPVMYNAKGWLKASRENPLNRVVTNFLQESTKEEISELFIIGKGLSLAVSDGSQSLRRVSSIRRTCSVAVKRKSISLQIKFTTDGLIETLRRTRTRFVFCMLAQHNAGLSDLIPGAVANESIINVPLLRSQVRGAEILPATRMYKLGFPDYVPHGEFKRRFKLLACSSGEPIVPPAPSSGVTITVNGQPSMSEAIDEAREVEEMLTLMDIDIMSYRIGLTQSTPMVHPH